MSKFLTSLTVAFVAAATLAGCAADQRSAEPAELTPAQLALLEDNLRGKVAGRPVRCIPDSRNDQTIRVSDDILLYRVSGRLVYRNDLRGSCPGLARDNDVIVSVRYGTGPCSGDIIRLVDRTSGFPGPSCVLGEFTPYRRAQSASRD